MAEDIEWKRGQTLYGSHIPGEIIEVVRTQLADWAKVVSQVCEEVREVQGIEKTLEFLETSVYRVLRSEIRREMILIIRLMHEVFAEKRLGVWLLPGKVNELQHTVPNLMKLLKRDIQIEANELKYRKPQAQQATESATPRARSRRGRSRFPFKETRELERQKKESDRLPEALKCKKQEDAQGRRSVFDHTPDYQVVHIRGREYQLTSRQAQVIEILHESHLRRQPKLGIDYILEKIDARTSRLRDIFRSRPDAMKDLVKKTGRGIVRLNL